MKHAFAILVCLTFTAAFAKDKVKASDIIKQINKGQAVEYANVEIEGDLDFTNLENERQVGNWVTSFDNGTYRSKVEVAVKFTECIFLGDVLAYYNIPRKHETHIAHFEKDAIFKNCTFQKASEFKYSEFNGVANFEGCVFNEAANFKYAQFSNGPLFANTKFESGADFKYTKFPRETSFEKATFHGLANFKYTKFRSPLNMKGVAFEGSEDFKYTRIDGKSFTSYLVRN
ncbi:MAG TPA: pentapeptide repeat-containing protein [Cyclobacteriaceae bacterium]|jgi:uncharacterized protein YjbI with pentapeptide repeats|nr:pentapeptide repeat-containing protein [Cyclobacteriaceae bacterium]